VSRTVTLPSLLQHLHKAQQVCVQLPTSADNVELPAYAAACHAVAQLLLTASRAAIDHYLLPAGPTAANSFATACSGRMMGRTDRQAD